MDDIVQELKVLGFNGIAKELRSRVTVAVVLPEQKAVTKALKVYFKKFHPELAIKTKGFSTAKKNPNPLNLYVEVGVKEWKTDTLPKDFIRAANRVVYDKNDTNSRGNIRPTDITLYVGEWHKVFKELGAAKLIQEV